MNMAISFGLITFRKINISGKERAVTAIINAKAVPIPTPLPINASAMGMVPRALE